jgi:hypothetical protein
MRNRLLLILLAGFVATVVKGEETERPYKDLVDNSPFLTPAFKERLGRRQSVSLKLKFTGYTKVGNVWFFALRDVKSGKHYWLAKDVEEDGIKVVAFKPAKELINVMVGEVEIDLSLETR